MEKVFKLASEQPDRMPDFKDIEVQITETRTVRVQLAWLRGQKAAKQRELAEIKAELAEIEADIAKCEELFKSKQA